MIRRKYFKKIFIIFFTFTLVYGAILTSYFVYQNKVNLETQQIDHSMTTSEQTVKNLDQRLWSLGKYTDTLFLDSYFTDYIITEDDYFIITKVYDKLHTDMAVFADMGARIAVTKMDDDLVISNQNTRNLDMFFEEMGFTEEMVASIYTFYEAEGNFKESLVLHDGTYSQIHVVKKRKVNNRDYLVLMMSLDTNVLKMGLQDTNFEFYVADREDEVGQLAQQILASDADYVIKNDQLYLLRQSSIYSDIYYMVDVAYAPGIELQGQYVGAALLFSVITLIGFMMALLITRNIYKPVGKVMSQFEDVEGDTRDEFAYLNKMTHEIIEANDNMKVTMGEHKIDLRTKFLRELVYGLVAEDLMSEGLVTYKLENYNTLCRVVLIELRELESYRTDYLSEARATIRKNVTTILRSRLTLEGSDFELVEMNYDSYALIIGHWPIEELKSSLSRVLEAVEGNEQVELVMSIGEEVKDYSLLAKSYDHASRIMDYKESYDKRAIVTMEDVVGNQRSDQFHYTLEIERELFNATINGSVEKIELIFQRITTSNFVDRQLNDQEKLGLVRSMMTTLRRIDQKMALETLRLYKETFESSISNNDSTSETIMGELLEVYIKYALVSKEKTESKDDEISAMMIHYIEEHYHEDISLEEAATHLNISAGYFCTIFKKHTGNNFKNYLNGYRVGQAKEILANEPEVKIKDLTLRLGYSNVNSFIRMFKKYEGVSPGEYAKRV